MRKTKYFLKSDILEAVTRSNSIKKVFLKISQKSPENNRAGFFSNKVSGWKLATFLMRSFDAHIFPVNVEKFSK